MSSSIFSSDSGALRLGLSQLAEVVRWTAERMWLAVVLATGVAILLSSQARQAPPSGNDHAIVDQQIRRSHTIPEADVLILGDSSGLTAIDPVRLAQDLGGVRVELLSAIGPIRPAGYARLLRNYLDRGLAVKMVLLVVHPFSLMSSGDAFGDAEVKAVLDDRWPSAGPVEDARRSLNATVLAGALDEPITNSFGPLYGNDAQLQRFIAMTHGSMIFPAAASRSKAAGSPQARDVNYTISDVARAWLTQARDVLRGATTRIPIFVAFGPVPASLGGETRAGDRRRMLAEVAAALDIHGGRILELPPTLPDDRMAEVTHPNERGRSTFTDAIAPILAQALADDAARDVPSVSTRQDR